MKVLVYGAGVIGGQLCHALCNSGNDVTVVARGAWAETLRTHGLRIHHQIQRTDTVDHPRVIEAPDNARYDVVFAVMQYKQMEAILDDLVTIDAPLVVLVGNNLSGPEMEEHILAKTRTPKTVLFGFGSTAGRREDGRVITVHVGDGKLNIGGLYSEAPAGAKAAVCRCFAPGSKYILSWQDNMDAWLKYHAAFILPTVYLCYLTGCNLRRSTRKQRKLLLDAAGDTYRLLMELGVPVRPVGDEKNLEPGPGRAAAAAIIYLAARTKVGAMCTTDHCRHAVGEMESLDTAFLALRAQRPDFPMPSFDALREAMPAWEELHLLYDEKTEGDKSHVCQI